jgi:hypothetical protein
MVLTLGLGTWRAWRLGNFLHRGGAPEEFTPEEGYVNKLSITILMVAGLALASGSPAAAQSAVEYGGVASQDHGVTRLGKSVNHTYGPGKKKGSSYKRGKAKG